jgi:hypothetical protein
MVMAIVRMVRERGGGREEEEEKVGWGRRQ